MPSQARLNFERFLLRDVHELSDLHRQRFVGPGRPQSFLTRSGIFLLCAAWELYCEDVIRAAFSFVVDYTNEPVGLPDQLRQTLGNRIEAEQNRNTLLELAGGSWREYLRHYVETELARLNTPNAENVSELFNRLVGIAIAPILTPRADDLTQFIRKRGDIAHRGADAGHVSIHDLDADYAFICGLVVELDNGLIDPLRQHLGWRPWNRRG